MTENFDKWQKNFKVNEDFENWYSESGIAEEFPFGKDEMQFAYENGSMSGETMKDMQVRLFKLEQENAELKEYKDKYHSTLRRIYSD